MEYQTYKVQARHPRQVFVAVVKALFFREIGMRISTGRSGLFWTFFEPFAQVFVFVAIHSAVFGIGASQSSYDFTQFMAIGFIAFNMFRSILNSSTGAFVANKGLFIYKQVKPVDTIIARALVEMFFTIVIIVIFVLLGFMLRYDIAPAHFILVVGGYVWLALFAMSLGILLATANVFFMSVGKIVSITSFLLLIASAVFFSVDSLPPAMRDVVLYNPVVHFMEMIHAAYLPHYSDRYVDYTYMMMWTLVPLSVGLWYYRYLEKKIISL